MKKTHYLIAALIASNLAFSLSAIANTPKSPIKTSIKKHDVPTATKPLVIILKDAPNQNAKVLANINPAQPLITIFEKGNWVKLANPSNGQVGWANIMQYETTMRAFYEPKTETQTVWIQSQKGDKNTVVKITAYQNGKKLSEKDAAQLYKKLQREQLNEWRQMQEFDRRMSDALISQARFFNHAYNQPLWMNVPMQPSIVIINPAPQAKLKTSPATAHYHNPKITPQ